MCKYCVKFKGMNASIAKQHSIIYETLVSGRSSLGLPFEAVVDYVAVI